MSDGPGDEEGIDSWARYLKRVTERPGWSVAKLARESGLNRSTLFRYMSEGSASVTMASVRAIAEAVGDPLNVVLRAAGNVEEAADEEIRMVIADPSLSPAAKKKLIDIIWDRREGERAQGMEQTRRMIEALRDQDAG